MSEKYFTRNHINNSSSSSSIHNNNYNNNHDGDDDDDDDDDDNNNNNNKQNNVTQNTSEIKTITFQFNISIFTSFRRSPHPLSSTHQY